MKKIALTVSSLLIGALALISTPVLAVTYTAAEVSQHNTASDCWTIINGKVYNLTSFIASHPGGQSAITSICGIDGSSAFNAMHLGNGTVNTALASLYIGDLATVDSTPPSVPANLAASATSSSQINLSWTPSTDNVGVTGYNIYRGGALIGTSITASFANTGLAASTTYSYTVRAFDAAGNMSAQSNTASATTLARSTCDDDYEDGDEDEDEEYNNDGREELKNNKKEEREDRVNRRFNENRDIRSTQNYGYFRSLMNYDGDESDD